MKAGHPLWHWLSASQYHSAMLFTQTVACKDTLNKYLYETVVSSILISILSSLLCKWLTYVVTISSQLFQVGSTFHCTTHLARSYNVQFITLTEFLNICLYQIFNLGWVYFTRTTVTNLFREWKNRRVLVLGQIYGNEIYIKNIKGYITLGTERRRISL